MSSWDYAFVTSTGDVKFMTVYLYVCLQVKSNITGTIFIKKSGRHLDSKNPYFSIYLLLSHFFLNHPLAELWALQVLLFF